MKKQLDPRTMIYSWPDGSGIETFEQRQEILQRAENVRIKAARGEKVSLGEILLVTNSH